MALKWLTGTATQGSADAFVQAEIPTGLLNVNRIAYRLRRVELYMAALPGIDSYILASVTRKSFAAMPSLVEPSLIFYRNRVMEFTTSGAVIQESIMSWDYTREEDVTLVEDPLYFQGDSNATSVANTFYVRLGYEQRNITEVERLALIAASLS